MVLTRPSTLSPNVREYSRRLSGTPLPHETFLTNTGTIDVTRSSTITNTSNGLTNALDLSAGTKAVTEATTSVETLPPQCVLKPEILQKMCTSMMMQNVTVEEAGVTMRTEIMNIIGNLFQHCDTRTFTIKIDFTLEF